MRQVCGGVAVALVLAAIGSVAGCRGKPVPLGHVVWMGDGLTYAIAGGYDEPHRLVRIGEGQAPADVAMILPSCEGPHVEALARVSEYAVVVATACQGEVGTAFFFVDVRNMETRLLARIDQAVVDLAWVDSAGRGYFATRDSSGRCWSIGAVANGRVARFDAPVTVDGRTWNIDDGLDSGSDCLGVGNASAPAAITGDVLYFAASGAASGVESYEDRRRAAASIVRRRGSDGDVTVVGSGFADVRDVAVSNDGRLLAVSGRREGRWSCWLVDVGTKHTRDLGATGAESAAFSPDGQRIAVVAGGEIVYAEIPA